MKIYYSATNIGFYPSDLKSEYIKAGTWPADAVELTESEKSKYWQKQPPTGKQLGSLNGRPAWVDIPPLSQEELNNQKIVEAKQYLKSTDWIIVKINEAQVQGQDTTAMLEQYSTELTERQASRDLINQLGVV